MVGTDSGEYCSYEHMWYQQYSAQNEYNTVYQT